MKLHFINSVILLLLFTTCKKDHSDNYAGEYYIRVPLVENDKSYLNANYGSIDLAYDAFDYKTLWKFIPAGDGLYNIAVADSTSRYITDFEGWSGVYPHLLPSDASFAAHQVFRIVRKRFTNTAYLQSNYSGKYIQLQFCSKDKRLWAELLITVADKNYCDANTSILSSADADTCYCVTNFELVRK